MRGGCGCGFKLPAHAWQNWADRRTDGWMGGWMRKSPQRQTLSGNGGACAHRLGCVSRRRFPSVHKETACIQEWRWVRRVNGWVAGSGWHGAVSVAWWAVPAPW
eukprot:363940-Chlamydomonas_euryale.AAC.10